MPRIVCPNCSYTLIRSSIACPNCGNALGGAPPVSTAPPPPLAPPPSMFGGYGTVITPGTSGTSPMTGPAGTATPVPTTATPVGAITVVKGGMRKLEGIVIDPPSTFEIPAQIDWSQIVLSIMLLPLFFIGLLLLITFLARRDQPAFRTTVTRLRIQQKSGLMRDARIEGDLMGTGISQGDTVSLQGQDRGGALIVSTGYNQSTGGNVIIHRRHSPIGTRIVVILLLAVLGFIFLLTLIGILATIHTAH